MQSFISATFSPVKTAHKQRVPAYVEQRLSNLSTEPFLAFRLFARDLGWSVSDTTNIPILLMVSPEKPVGDAEGCYLVLDGAGLQSDEPCSKMLTVQPSFPSRRRPLYLHTSPLIYDERYHVSPELGKRTKHCDSCADLIPHVLDNASFESVCQAIRDQGEGRRRKISADRRKIFSEEDKELEEKSWDSWGGKSATQPFQKICSYVFDHLPFKAENIPILCEPTIVDEILFYNQLLADFLWPGFKYALSWAENITFYASTLKVPSYSLSPSSHIFPSSLSEDLQLSAKALSSMKIPCDGDLPSDSLHEDEDDGEFWDLGDEEEPEFEIAKKIRPAEAKRIRLIAFDLYDTLLDRQSAISEALALLTHGDQGDKLLTDYIENEALQSWQNPTMKLPDLVRASLMGVVVQQGLSVTPALLDSSAETVLLPRLHQTALDSLNQLLSDGYTLLILSHVDAGSFETFIKPRLPSVITDHVWTLPSSPLLIHKQSPSLYLAFLDYCKGIHPDIEPDQILMVSTGLFRVIEPANAAGLPTMLLQRSNDLESNVALAMTEPTFIISNFEDIHSTLSRNENGNGCQEPATIAASTGNADSNATIQSYSSSPSVYRICNFYQTITSLGCGTACDTVWSAIQVHTGSEFAIKVGRHLEYTNRVSVLSYENAIYTLLRGHPAIPRIHWQGMDGGIDVLIMEKLGPNLGDLRRFCRRRLSLKTVLMLADQLISNIEFVHARGIIFRDVKPSNFAMGAGAHSNIVYMFDFGMAKLYVNPETGKHIPYREGRYRVGTPRYASANAHFGIVSRRDDMEALGHTLLYLLHGRLPWQKSENYDAIDLEEEKVQIYRLGVLKTGKAMQALLAKSPPEFTHYFDHCRGLAFEEQPDYELLQSLFRSRMEAEGWKYDWKFDWIGQDANTLVAKEHKFEKRFVHFTSKDI